MYISGTDLDSGSLPHSENQLQDYVDRGIPSSQYVMIYLPDEHHGFMIPSSLTYMLFELCWLTPHPEGPL